VCFEMVEHLWREEDLAHYYLREQIDADMIFLSTPLYTYGAVNKEWRGKDLGHVRTYTKAEFIQLAMSAFPNRNWCLELWHTMVLTGAKKCN